MLRPLLGTILGVVARFWLWTLRIEVSGEFAGFYDDPRPFVLAFFHGQQMGLLAWKRRRPTAVLVSLSKDGDVQARVLPQLGMIVRRGSTSRGGVKGLAAIVRVLRAGGTDAAFSVDGPKGPRGTVHPGAVLAAARSDGVIVPIASACARALVVRKAWDRYEIPLPFSLVAVVIGAPIDAKNREGAREAIRTELARLRETAERRVNAAISTHRAALFRSW